MRRKVSATANGSPLPEGPEGEEKKGGSLLANTETRDLLT
jgi:hypothetical protein